MADEVEQRRLEGTLARAAELLRAGRWRAAVELLRGAAERRPDDEAIWGNLGHALLGCGRTQQAVEALRRACQLAPDVAELWYNLASAERAVGDPSAAVASYERALALEPEWADAWNNLALALCDDGMLEAGIDALRRAVELEPRAAAAHTNLGNALRQLFRYPEAAAAYRRALELDGTCAAAAFNLHALVYAEDDPEPAAALLEQALLAEPAHGAARFFLGTLRAQQGQEQAARHHFARVADLPEPPRHWLDSWSYIQQRRTSATRLFALSGDVLDYGLEQARRAGLVLELGVRRGVSIRFIAARTAETVHGFDSFQGLPEAWGANPAGTYSTAGVLPEVPANVELHAGWFSESLPAFLDRHRGPVRFVNVDCDLYRSTAAALAELSGRIVGGSVLVFDEYLGYPGWREGEFKAFREAAAARGWRYEYLAFSLFSRQAVVRVLSCS